MRRREPPIDLVPVDLRTFDPVRWLEPGEDRTDPVRCHVTARCRYQSALCTALHAFPSDPSVATVMDRTEGLGDSCPCSMCRRAS